LASKPNCERFLTKGRLVGIQGRIQTGSYKNKEGATVYTTDVVANNVEFLEWGDRGGDGARNSSSVPTGFQTMDEPSIPEGFSSLDDDDIPF